MLFKNFSVIILFICSSLINKAYSAEKPAIELANNYRDQAITIKDYWVSEKLDGIRGYWNGKELISRQGNIINSPLFFTKNWPAVALDGELWLDRNAFEATSSCVRKKVADENCWQNIRFMVFDLPKHQGNFTSRLSAIKKIINTTQSQYLDLIPQFRLANKQELKTKLAEIVALGGEGLMLHHQDAYYHTGRSDLLLKVKQRHDAEAIVIGYLPGKGKYQGMLGALQVKTSDGIIFNIGSGFTDEERKKPPALGTIITYQYFSKTVNGIPRFASFLRIDANKQIP